MSEQNPLIQATMQRTLFDIINALQYLITTLSGTHNTHQPAFTEQDIKGLSSLLNCIRGAVDACYEETLTDPHAGAY
jgi:cob(I)alamin adenosyltransferase